GPERVKIGGQRKSVGQAHVSHHTLYRDERVVTSSALLHRRSVLTSEHWKESFRNLRSQKGRIHRSGWEARHESNYRFRFADGDDGVGNGDSILFGYIPYSRSSQSSDIQ